MAAAAALAVPGSSSGKAFSKKSWHLLLPHAEYTLSMLRPSKINPLISACAMLSGHHGFRRRPAGAAGAKAAAREPKAERGQGWPGVAARRSPDGGGPLLIPCRKAW